MINSKGLRNGIQGNRDEVKMDKIDKIKQNRNNREIKRSQHI